MATEKHAVILALKDIMEQRGVDTPLDGGMTLRRLMKATSGAVTVACGVLDMDVMGTARDMMMSLPVVAAYLVFGCDGDMHDNARALLAEPALENAEDAKLFRSLVEAFCDRFGRSEQLPDLVGVTVLFTHCQRVMLENGWDRMSSKADRLYDRLYDQLKACAADGGMIDVNAWLKDA